MFRTALLFVATAITFSCSTDNDSTLPAADKAQPFNVISPRQFGLNPA